MIDVVQLTVDPNVWERSREALDEQGVEYRGILVNHTPLDIDTDWLVLGDGENHSFSQGVNRALARVESEHVLLLSDDAYLRPGALKAMLDHDHPIVGAVCVSGNGLTNHVGGTFTPRGVPIHINRDLPPDELDACRHAEWATAACLLFWRSVIDTVGTLDERYWFSHEDVDYQLRAREVGFGKPLVCTDAVVDHQENGVAGKPMPLQENLSAFAETWIHSGRLEKVRSQ